MVANKIVRQNSFKVWFAVLLVLVSVFVLKTHSVFAARNTAGGCKYQVRVAGTGKMPNGKQYYSFEYQIIGDDYARASYDENGSRIFSNGNCGAGSALAQVFWPNGSSVDLNSSAYRNLFGGDVEDVYMGLPNGANYVSDQNYSGVGISDRATCNGRPWRDCLGISKVSDSTTYAIINDGAQVAINGNPIWCLGMSGNGTNLSECATNAATVYPGGGDFAGYLNGSNGNALDRIVPAFRSRVQNRSNINGLIGFPGNKSFGLTMAAINTRDFIAPGADTQKCIDELPGQGDCPSYYPPDPFSNAKAGTVLTYVGPPRPGSNTYPDGRIDNLVCPTGIKGWAVDPDTPSVPAQIHIYDGELGRGGVLIGGVVANEPWNSGESPPYGSTAGRFTLKFEDFPSLYSGRHSIYFYLLDSEGGPFQNLNDGEGGPITFEYERDCPQPVPSDTYEIIPQATVRFTDDREDPSKALINTGLSRGAPTNGTVTRRFFVLRNGVRLPSFNTSSLSPTTSNPDVDSNRNMQVFDYPEITIDNPISALGLRVGDQLCVEISVTPHILSIKRSGVVSVTDNGPFTPPPACDILVNRPYISVYGADVFTGGGYTNGCSQVSKIDGYTRSTDLGAGVQFAAYAIGAITDFNTARLHSGTNLPLPPKGLTFANDGTSGNFVDKHCQYDYYRHRDDDKPAQATGSTVNDNDLDSSVKLKASGSVTLAGSGDISIADGDSVSLYVDGDVTIKNNITYFSADSGWSNPSRISSFYLIVRGNIYIDPDVTRLDGVYIAQPGAPTPIDKLSGFINTCADTSSTPAENHRIPVTSRFNSCDEQLTVNGAFQAQLVFLDRVGPDSLRDSSTGETTSGNSKAAEVFNFSPEIYMAIPQIPRTEDSGGSSLDSVQILPPVL